MFAKILKFGREIHSPKVQETSSEPAEKVCSSSESSSDEVIFQGGSTVIANGFKIHPYLQSVDENQQLADSEVAKVGLEDEFRNILNSLTNPVGPNSRSDPRSSTGTTSTITDSTTGCDDFNYSEYGAKIKVATEDLRRIAETMNSTGHLNVCVRVYKSVRKSYLGTSFRKLGMDKLRADEVRGLEWKALEEKIKLWTRAAKICIPVLFLCEKRLCEKIFEGLGTATADTCFMDMVKDRAIHLFNFAEAVATSRRSPERLFKILDLRKTLLELFPVIDAAFHSKSSESIFIQAGRILPQLAETARGILSEFEKAVLHELSNVRDRGGKIYPLTIYVMNYIIQISSYKETLGGLMKPLNAEEMKYLNDLKNPDMEFGQLARRTPLAAYLVGIIYILQYKLKGKSKHYEDPSLAQLFMINNVHYIVQKIEESPVLREMIGDDYVEKLTQNVRQAVSGYQKLTWARIFHCLRDEGRMSKRALGERVKSFNAMFEDVHRTQATWLVPDSELRNEIRSSILEELIPAYRSFRELWDSYSHIRKGKPREECIKYSVEDLETKVSNLFEGHSSTSISRSQ